MDHATRASVTRIAEHVRYWVSTRAPQHEQSLIGWCAIASGMLFKKLQSAGIVAELRMWTCPDTLNSHVFVVVEDHVVDVTATQFAEFRAQPVVVMHERVACEYQFYHHTNVFRSVDELRQVQISERWPHKQVAYA